MITPRTVQTPGKVAAHYDDLDVFYREIWGEHVHHGLWQRGDESVEEAVRHMVDVVAERAMVQPGHRVCDVGCGYGATARYLAAVYGADVCGLTLSSAQHAYACAHTTGTTPTYLLRDWLANDLPAAAFDAVVSIECLSHVPDKQRFFDEAYRVLRPGGRLVVCAWLADDTPAPWQVRHLLEPICREGCLPGLPTAAEVQAFTERAGLVLGDFEEVSRQVQRTWTIIAWRVLGRLLTDARYLRFLRDAHQRNRVFLLTLPRLWLAYRTGALRYGLFTAHKPA